jgi:predicted ATPase/Tfp pilus assembly protein PilF
MEAVGGLLDDYEDGVWLVELAPVADPGLVPQAVAAALGVREDQSRPLEEAMQGYLRDKKLLLLMDNCEHLIDACARLAETLLRANPDLNLLATSRESLGIPGETALRVPSLTVPDPRQPLNLAELARFDAVRLFVDRAGAVLPGFRLNEQNGPAVAQLVTRLDGIPLAIELAAARLKALSVEQVAERLNDRFRLLTGGSRTALPRQQTLQALIDWSYDLLSEAERALLRRLSVFAGGFSLEAAEVVSASNDEGERRENEAPGSTQSPASFNLQPSDVLDLLMRLVDKSLVISEPAENGGRARYRLLETIRQYALERLIEAGGAEAARARGRHLSHFLALAEQAEPQLRGAEQMAWLDRLDLEHDNLRAALEWALGAGRSGALDGLRLAASLWRFWYLRSSRTEGRAWLERALAAPSGTGVRDLADLAAREPALAAARAKALAGLAWLTSTFNQEVPAYAESLALCRALNDRWGQAFALRGLATAQLYDGDKDQARGLLQESLEIYRQLEDAWGEALVLFNLAWLPKKTGGELGEGVELWTESLRLFRRTGDRWGMAVTLAALSQFARTHGDYDRAAALSHDSLALFRELGDRAGMASSLNHLALVAYRRGDYGQARELLEKNLALNRETSNVGGESWALLILGLVACYQGEFARAGDLLDRSAGLLEQVDDQDDMVLLLAFRGLLAFYQGDEVRAELLWQECLALAREHNEQWNYGIPMNGLGLIALRQGQRAQAAELFEESLAASRAVGEKRNEAMSLCSLGRLARTMQDFDAAQALYRQSLQLRRELGAKRGTAESLGELARLAVAQGGPENARRAARLFGAAEALRERIGAPLPPVERDEHERCVEAARASLEAEESVRLWAEGRAMGMEAAVAYALESA